MRLKESACEALQASLKHVLPPDRAALIDANGRTESFEDNIVESLSTEQINLLRAQLAGGDGHELEPGPDGRRPDAHAAHASATLAFNAFGAWLGRERDLVIDGVSGFDQRLRIEARQRIFRGGRAPNLDCLAAGSGLVAGVESKLTETLARHQRTEWSDAYRRESCRSLLSDGWLNALDAARTGKYTAEYLDVEQLIKHALGLAKQNPDHDRHLVYIYWEPTNGDTIAAVRTHRREVEILVERVGDASPQLHALTYGQLWRQWESLPRVAWLHDHLSLLRARYEISVDWPRLGSSRATGGES